MSLLLGLDFGTGGIRVGLFDPDRRTIVATAEETYATRHPQPGWAEQSPGEWWDALGRACRRVMTQANTPEIAGIAVATTASTVVVCSRDGTPLRPALLWMDCRAGIEAHRTGQSTHPVMAQSGGSDAAEWLVPKAMWLATHEPKLYDAAEIICECVDWVNFRLTGQWVGSRMNATCKWNYDGAAEQFHPELYESFGAPGLVDRLPQRIVRVGDAIDRLSTAAALHLGLGDQRPVVAQGGIDAHIGILGADTVAPGKLLLIGGTSVVHLFHLADDRPVPGFWGPYPGALIDDLWLVEGGQVSAGSVLSWLSGQIFQLDNDGTQRLIEEASRRPAQDSGLLTLDYFMGNRTPYRDPHLRGAILGLSLGHDRASMYRSAVEGVALASANVVAQAQLVGVPVDRIVSAGGYCKNALWLRATVDAIGLPIQLAAEENLTIVGTAAAAATGVGLFPDLRSAAAAVARDGRLIEPDMVAHRRYVESLERYRDATTILTPILHRLSAGPDRREDRPDVASR
ncbi:sugar kinase [Lichenicola cladoniae]|uniref:Sugar kinase n=1 Tax=Lichenicola cladoniae TaxID=1484109 RepID=A0A6M8HU90_9PROT|nr:FGGY-family carbohydrate kinase [Lichenicola cladoniae]NPD66226.1 sugar kinase [Acetobacteraceae bacterium]QKE92083.1 sugar kinase [Lichenicola cladoniae]